MRKIQDELTDLPITRFKKYELRHPEKIKAKRRKKLVAINNMQKFLKSL